MPIVTSDLLAASLQGYRALFNKSFAAFTENNHYTRIATVVDSVKDSEKYTWFGATAGMREWIGERVENELARYELTVQNKKYEASMSVEREAIEDDNLNMVKPRIEDMGMRAAAFPDKLVLQLLDAGFSTACYDSQYFFDTDHSSGDSGTQSNSTDAAFSQTALETGIVAMRSFVDDRGEPLDIIPDTLVVSPADEFNAWEVLNSVNVAIDGGGGTLAKVPTGNAMRNIIPNIIVSPYITSGRWMLLATKYPVRPLIFQWRIKPEFVGVTDPSDEYVFRADRFKYGARARAGAGLGLWQLAYGSTGDA
jgi:phage major head subunit gpT-like protein